MKDSVGIYLHSPFCGSKCGYCSFYSFPGTEQEKNAYIRCLEGDVLKGIHSLENDYEYATIYFGGGTPSCFPASHFSVLLNKIIKNLVKRSIPVKEVTVEVNPADYDFNELTLLRDVGVSRISIGLQSLTDDDLSVMGRRHSVETALKTVDDAVKVGFSGVSGDLIYGLPNQNFSQWKEGLKTLCNLGLNHVSLYELTLEEGTPFFKNNFSEDNEDNILQFLDSMLQFLRANGFQRYEISNFAKGSENRSQHNLNYWRQRDYLGFGPSAVSTIGTTRMTTKSSLKDYLAGNIQYETEELSKKELQFERIMLGLRSSEGVSKEFIGNYQVNYFSKEERISAENSLGNFIDNRCFEEKNGIISFTDKGFLLYNEIIGKIL